MDGGLSMVWSCGVQLSIAPAPEPRLCTFTSGRFFARAPRELAACFTLYPQKKKPVAIINRAKPCINVNITCKLEVSVFLWVVF